MKKAIAKILRKAAFESSEFPDSNAVKVKYKKMKRAWKKNVKNGTKLNNN